MEYETRTILIALNYLGWGIATLLGFGYWNQRKEISKLMSIIEVLKKRDESQREKEKSRDELIMQMIRVMKDQNITIDNRKKLDEAFSKFEKSNTND